MMKKLKFTLIIPCLFLAIYSICLASSDYYYRQAVKQFSIDANASDETDFTKTLNLLEKSLKLQKHNASSLDLKGEVLYRQWWKTPDSTFLSASALLQKSKELHLKALTIRKEWVFSVLQIVRIESHTPELGDDFFKWFDKAYSLGLNETTAALELFKIGVWRWSELNIKAKNQVIELANSSIAQKRNNLKAMASYLRRANLFELICIKTEPTSRQRALCQST